MFEHCPDNVLKHIENSEMGHLSKIRRKKMNKNQLKTEILEYIKAHAGTSFVEIERVFEENNFDYKGDGAYTSGQHPNVVFWIGWNQEAFDVIAELKKDRRIEMDICEPIVYMVDGKGLDLPIVKSKNIKTDHWLPVTFTISKKETECV
uniref:Pathogenicity island protein n=1 Tax=Staphylococcus aureus TaxID=1280 RepID=G8I0X6_STAAU|nr:hypothetical protein [Staphylococcus aureus]